jgi:hypothetical protein
MNSDLEVTVFAGDGHPDENQILLALERELPNEGLAEIEKHLGECWSCRARSEEMRRGILAFVEYRENRYLTSLAGPPNEFRNFAGELRKVIAESDSGGVAKRLRETFSALLTLPTMVRWSAAVAVVTAIALFWTQVLFNPVAVSANELLARAIAAQSPGAPAKGQVGKRKTIRQKVQIRKGGRIVVRDFEWTAGEPVRHARWEMAEDVDRWNSPLTAEGFAEWRDSLAAKGDKVEGERNALKLTTIAETGLVKKASIVVRSTDFHPVEQHIVFADEQALDFLELRFEVADEVAPAVPEQSGDASLASQGRRAKSQVNLDELELAVRYALFTQKLDLGEDLSITRTGNEVTVGGTASSKERTDAIVSLLGRMDRVRVKVTSPEATNAPKASGSKAKEASVASASPLGGELLATEFPSSSERTYFVDAWLSASDKALTHAWALKRLAERYTEKEESRLTPESADKLREMLQTHLQAVGQANADVDSLLKLLPHSSDAPDVAPADLRTGILLLFRQVHEQDSLIAKLVAGTPAAGDDLASASKKLRASHRAVQESTTRLRDLLEAR